MARKFTELSEGEETLALHLKAAGIPFRREVRFHPVRLWRFDFLIGDWLAVEVEGAPGRGRHTSAKGFTDDCIKYNEAALMGFRVLRFTTRQVKSGRALDTIKAAYPHSQQGLNEPQRGDP